MALVLNIENYEHQLTYCFPWSFRLLLCQPSQWMLVEKAHYDRGSIKICPCGIVVVRLGARCISNHGVSNAREGRFRD
jgi:hypothetical protein